MKEGYPLIKEKSRVLTTYIQFLKDINKERVEREYDLELITTAPSVTHSVYMKNGEINKIQNPSEWPETQFIDYITEPWVKTTIITPENYIGKVTEFLSNKRGEFGQIDYIQNSKIYQIKEL